MAGRLERLRKQARLNQWQQEDEIPRAKGARLEARKLFVSGDDSQVLRYHELDRILALPFMARMTDAEYEYYCQMNILAPAYESGFRFFREQAEAIAHWEQFGGLVAPIGVGFGKTLITLVIANKAYNDKGKDRILLLVPPEVFYQLTQVDIRWARSKVPFSVPVHLVAGTVNAKRRMALAKSGRRGLYISTYSCLSTQNAFEMIDSIAPDMVICDEAHSIANKNAARTKRLIQVIDKYDPDGVALSGTITSKSIMDYHHLSRWCLGENSPLPMSPTMASEWALLLDAEAEQHHSNSYAPIAGLLGWARDKVEDASVLPSTVSGYRRAYQIRLTSCPGVVATGDADIGVSLYIHNMKTEPPELYKGYDKLAELMAQVDLEWVTPNGDEIDHAMHCYKWNYELSSGFYNQLTWPEPDVLAARLLIGEDKAQSLLEEAQECHAKQQDYHKLLRSFLKDNTDPHMDTPMLVGSNMSHYGDRDVPTSLFLAWRKWKDLQRDGLPERDSTAIRVCDFKVQQAVEWAKVMGCGIIWVWNVEMGLWCYEYLKAAGIDVLHCPAGEEFNRKILDKKNGKRIVVASIRAHGTGKNLQHFQNQLFLQWPRQAKQAEQTIGRTHRNGQKADELYVHTMHILPFDKENFAACLNDALYIHQTTSTRQKLIYATYDPLPKIYPPEMLKEKGMQVQLLSVEQRSLLAEKFGQEI